MKEILECINIEQSIIPDCSTLSQKPLSQETQMGLLALSEKFLGVPKIDQIVTNGITADKGRWISNLGLNAMITACKCHGVTIENVALADYLNKYKTETIAEKMAHCLNIYEDVFEMVSKIFIFIEE